MQARERRCEFLSMGTAYGREERETHEGEPDLHHRAEACPVVEERHGVDDVDGARGVYESAEENAVDRLMWVLERVKEEFGVRNIGEGVRHHRWRG